MRIEITEAETDYLYRLLMGRPMGEVEPLVLKLRVQVSRQQAPQTTEAPASEPAGASRRPDGAGDGDDSLPLP